MGFNNNRQTYFIVNLLLSFLIAAIFLYAELHEYTEIISMKCYYQTKFQRNCPTCGITRAFAKLFRGRMEEANKYNPHAVPLFCFFSIQLFIRMVVSFSLWYWKDVWNKRILAIDLMASTAFFIVAFHELVLHVISFGSTNIYTKQ